MSFYDLKCQKELDDEAARKEDIARRRHSSALWLLFGASFLIGGLLAAL